MTAKIISLAKPRVDPLCQFMSDSLMMLIKDANSDPKEKFRIGEKILSEFFKRLRLQNKVSLHDLASQSNTSFSELIRFELGQSVPNKKIEDAYLEFCFGSCEARLFCQEIHKFLDRKLEL